MAVLEDAIRFLDQLGAWDVALPFILVFTLVYAVLEKTKVFGTEGGKPKHRINALVAFVIAFFVLIAVDVLNVINIIAQYLVFALVAIMMLAIVLGLMGFKELKKSIAFSIGLIIVGALVLYILGYLNILSISSLRFFFETPLIAVIVMLLLVFFVTRGAKGVDKGEEAERKRKEDAEKKRQEEESEEEKPTPY